VVAGRMSGRMLDVWLLDECQAEYTLPDSVQQTHVQQPSTYAKPEASSAV
jgi:hypothetical protein